MLHTNSKKNLDICLFLPVYAYLCTRKGMVTLKVHLEYRNATSGKQAVGSKDIHDGEGTADNQREEPTP